MAVIVCTVTFKEKSYGGRVYVLTEYGDGKDKWSEEQKTGLWGLG